MHVAAGQASKRGKKLLSKNSRDLKALRNFARRKKGEDSDRDWFRTTKPVLAPPGGENAKAADKGKRPSE